MKKNVQSYELKFETMQDQSLDGRFDHIGKTYQFTFLNKVYSTNPGEIDWNHPEFGKLWTYNLNYFEFLFDKSIKKETGIELVMDFIEKSNTSLDGLEPYPISLRVINWIKFLTKYKVKEPKIDNHLYAQVEHLTRQVEYHLLGNHILENAFALLFAAYYFNDSDFYKTAKRLLNQQLSEQITDDGAHFEQSPMYHQIMLFRVLDSLQLTKGNALFDEDLLPTLRRYAEKMMSWLKAISFRSGAIPMFNDSAYKIAPTSEFLYEYGRSLGIDVTAGELSSSGYRAFQNKDFEVRLDVGNVVASYQPGHTHADTLSFELYHHDNPIIVDPGVSTYADLDHRIPERATSYHNTLTFFDRNSTEVWSAFRVASRAKVKILEESVNMVRAQHSGYQDWNETHERKFTLLEDSFVIRDKVTLKSSGWKSNIHFHPSCKVKMVDDHIFVNDLIIELKGYDNIEFKAYNFARGFNDRIEAIKLEATVEKESHINLRTC